MLATDAGVVQWQNVSFPKWIIMAFSTTYRNSEKSKLIVASQEQ
jgi:hypothetical protein